MKHILRNLFVRLFSALKGCMLWRSIVHQHKIPADCAMILLPSPTDKACALFSVKHLEAFLQCNTHFKKAAFLSGNMKLDELIERYQVRQYVKAVVILSEQEINQLVDFYNTNENDGQFIVASLSVPFGRNAYAYTNIRSLSEEDVFTVGLYNILKGFEHGFIAQTPAQRGKLQNCEETGRGAFESLKRYGYGVLKRLGNLPYIKTSAFFAVGVLAGYRIYGSLRKNYGEDVCFLICPHPGTGDIYNIGLYFTAFLKKSGIKYYTFLYRGESERQVGRLFGIQGDTILTERETVRLTRFVRFIGPQYINLVQLHHYPLPVYANAGLANFEGYKGITFTQMFRDVAMGLGGDTTPAQPRFSNMTGIDEIFDEKCLLPGKTVVLAPYSSSAQVIPWGIWKALAEKLKKAGYTVATNCVPGKETPVAGTVELGFEYRHAKDFLEYAGFFVGARSGFCDVISSISCKKIVLTPFWSASLPWLGGPGKTMCFYGMWPNYGRRDTAEIEYDRGSMELIPDKVIELLDQPGKWKHEIRVH